MFQFLVSYSLALNIPLLRKYKWLIYLLCISFFFLFTKSEHLGTFKLSKVIQEPWGNFKIWQNHLTAKQTIKKKSDNGAIKYLSFFMITYRKRHEKLRWSVHFLSTIESVCFKNRAGWFNMIHQKKMLKHIRKRI